MRSDAEYRESLDASRGLLYGLAGALAGWAAIACGVVTFVNGLS